MAAAAATTRPVVLELGGNDAAILAPDVAGDAALADRIVEAAFVTSGQVCMAIKRLYVHRDRLDETVDALAGRLATEMVGDGLAEGVTMGPVHTAGRARPGRGVALRGRRRRAPCWCGRASVRARTRERGATSSRRRSWWRRRRTPASCARSSSHPPCRSSPTTTSTRRSTRPTTPPFGLCASVWSNDDALAADVAARLSAGTVFVNAHGMSAIDMYAPMGGWKQSGFGVELGDRGHAGVRPPAGAGAPAGARGARKETSMTWPSAAGRSSTGRARRRSGPTCVIEGERIAAIGPGAGGRRRRHRDRRHGHAGHARASSTCTRTTTRSSSGTPTPARRRCTA